jgi:hypothetical protein
MNRWLVTETALGIAIGVAAGGALLVAAATYVWRRWVV